MSTTPDLPLSPARLAAMQAALRLADPQAELSVDPASGQLTIVSALPSNAVLATLNALGPKVELVEQATPADGGGCCGCCGG